MADYQYARAAVNGLWDINHPSRVDGESNQIYLVDELLAAVPGVAIRTACSGTICIVTTDRDLTQAEQDTIAAKVSDHRNNV